mmetsp:Transcript_107162/g.277185  ORF Transcript_107162/g.277185 Transcript_107162/m.277185 type:complete len:195 (+) Transcript_107162:2201-2785(+)
MPCIARWSVSRVVYLLTRLVITVLSLDLMEVGIVAQLRIESSARERLTTRIRQNKAHAWWNMVWHKRCPNSNLVARIECCQEQWQVACGLAFEVVVGRSQAAVHGALAQCLTAMLRTSSQMLIRLQNPCLNPFASTGSLHQNVLGRLLISIFLSLPMMTSWATGVQQMSRGKFGLPPNNEWCTELKRTMAAALE